MGEDKEVYRGMILKETKKEVKIWSILFEKVRMRKARREKDKGFWRTKEIKDNFQRE